MDFDGVAYVRSPRLEDGFNRIFSKPPGLPAFLCPRGPVVAQ
jgi:hypothetical protein